MLGGFVRVTYKKSNFKKGSIELLVLHLLSIQDCYGYQLTQLIEQLSDGRIVVQEGALYPVLYKLSDDSLISEKTVQVGKRKTRVYYHLEPSGIALLEDLRKDYFEVHDGIQAVLNSKEVPNNE